MAKTGKTTGNLKMRSGPGMQFEPPVAFLVPDTELEVLAEDGDWLHVRAGGKEGYVGRKYVEIHDSPSLGHPADSRERGAAGDQGERREAGGRGAGERA